MLVDFSLARGMAPKWALSAARHQVRKVLEVPPGTVGSMGAFEQAVIKAARRLHAACSAAEKDNLATVCPAWLTDALVMQWMGEVKDVALTGRERTVAVDFFIQTHRARLKLEAADRVGGESPAFKDVERELRKLGRTEFNALSPTSKNLFMRSQRPQS